jgi:large subunit ribosomal protein L10
MSKVLRRKMVDDLAARFKDQKNLVLVDAKGLTANQTVELRAQLREGQVRMRLLKNSVAVHTFRKLGIPSFEKHLDQGMNAIVYGPDPLAIARKLVAYREKHQRPAVKAALIEGRAADAAAITALSKLPGREQLLSMLLGALNGVVQKFVSTLNEIPRSFVGTLKAVSEKK